MDGVADELLISAAEVLILPLSTSLYLSLRLCVFA